MPLLLVALVAFAIPLYATQQCYCPSGYVSSVDQPCDNLSLAEPAHLHSSCCPPASIYSENKLCIDVGTGHALRASCTDASWQSDACPSFCHATEEQSFGRVYMELVATQPNETSYCCCPEANMECDCAGQGLQGEEVVTLPLFKAEVTIPARNSTGTSNARGKHFSKVILQTVWLSLVVYGVCLAIIVV